MSSTNFVNGITLTDADWFNDTDRVVYDILQDPADADAIVSTLEVLPLAGGTLTGALTLSGAPTTDLHAATKAYVDTTVSTGLNPTDSVGNATTANVTLSGEQTIDGVLTATSRILVKNQTAPAENGIYVTAAGAWSRATDMDNWLEVPGRYTFVTAGTTQANTGWSCTSVAGGTLNTTAITWAQFSSPGTYIAGTGLDLTGSTFSVEIGTTVQGYDADLTAIAGLTSAADKLPYFTGSGTAALADFTSTARNLLDDASTSAMRTTLGLAIGTDVQAQDAELAALAGLTSAADKLPYFTGSGTATTTDFTTAGRALLDDANASAQRTTLGLAIGTNVQAWDANLDQLAALAVTDSNIIVGDGAAWVAESGATARTSLGLGTIATQNSNNVTITGGSITAITDLTVADGGTGRSTSTTAYGLIAAGTTATGAHQTLAAGATTEILVGGGAASLPVWTTAQGSGAPVRATSPTLTTPVLGVASATSLTLTNDLAVTEGGTGASTAANARTNLGIIQCIPIAASDETTALTTGTKVVFRMPFAFTLTAVRASLTTAQTSGNIFTVDIHETGTTVLSTKITIDNAEKTSTTAVTAPVISDTALADDAEITIDIDQIGDGTAKGLKVYLIGRQ